MQLRTQGKILGSLLMAALSVGCAKHTYVGPVTGKTYEVRNMIPGPLGRAGGAGFAGNYKQEVRVAEYLDQAGEEIPDEVVQDMLTKKIRMGMTRNQVLTSWGAPRSTHETVTASGAREQWVYGDPLGSATYVYFMNGELTSWSKQQ